MGAPTSLAETSTLSGPTVLAGISTALAMFLLCRNFQRMFLKPRNANTHEQPATPNWLPSIEKGDRRRLFRRSGEPSSVLIVGIDGNRRLDGRVLDRSTAGLRLDSPLPAPAGATLLVRAPTAPDDSLWVPVDVRWCRPGRNRSEIGCRFVDDVSMSTLLFFG